MLQNEARCARMRGYNVQECGGEQYTPTATDFVFHPFPSLFVAMSEFTPAPRLTLHTFFSLSDVEGGGDKYNPDGDGRGAFVGEY